MATTYTAKDITVLEGLEPVRKRPGMYIGGVGSSGLHHLVWEILDNSIDEAMNGYASNISVALHEDGSSITISDDGRGIPVDKHPKTKKSALEVIFSTLHAGGKFEGGNYKTAGGLHGVGASVVNALSKELVATVRRDGSQWEMRFKQGAHGWRAEEARRRSRHRDDGVLPTRQHDFSEGRVRRRPDSSTPGDLELPAQGRQDHVRERSDWREGCLPALRGPVRLPEEDSRRAVRRSGARVAVRRDQGERRERLAPRSRAAVDAVDRRARAQLRQWHPDGFGRHARERVPRRPRQGSAQLHRDPQSLAEGRDADGRRHPRRPRRACSACSCRSRSSRARQRIASTTPR